MAHIHKYAAGMFLWKKLKAIIKLLHNVKEQLYPPTMEYGWGTTEKKGS